MAPRTPDSSFRCVVCQKKDSTPPDLIPCSTCPSFVHFVCIGFKNKRTAVVNELLNSPLFQFRCTRCLDSGSDTNDTEIPAHALSKALSQLETLTASLSGMVENPKPLPSTYAAAATKGIRRPGPSGLAAALLAAQQDKEEEEKRLRSAVISGLPEIDGVSDKERVLRCLATAGIGGGVEVMECYRMGKAPTDSDSAISNGDSRRPGSTTTTSTYYPRKIKLVLKSPQMLAAVLSKKLRSVLRDPDTCPDGFSEVYFNPSRTHAKRKFLSLLRQRRNLLNTDIPDSAHQWFIDHNRSVLVKRNDGNTDWYGPGDTGLLEWIQKEEEKPDARSRTRNGSLQSGQGSQPGKS